ncbi:MAG TPA: 50S ribosome-binding GTPase [Candidatus Sumerlaeota bacterium]|nr:MAG: GTPase ObgE [candidate division BRC1 bacterium ADurb.Bin183]HOE62790.1 50S ribosome-binding GTPase [Candidatus Sumerlaeota bacterium]HRR29681.1 50S ribosome-binding GTPase [Candidatus Sumerlaeia bacterium]HON50350.1 50S ribosome-binding GTPase [Candidatus Sumerlaeota bacterium]HOR63566.1 50S ribosome-binding GTPase [Candidatus Sumerlaeota bacterium]
MPANLTPDFHNADKAFKEAKTDEERLAALEEMLRTIPKHKGTEKMQADIKRRISKIKLIQESKSGKKGFSYHVDKEGAGQVALVGGPNTGKSQLLKSLTKAEPMIAPYPFTTSIPMPGMMAFEDVKIQLIDLPPFSPEHTETWLPEVVRAANAILFVVSLTGMPEQDIEFVTEKLEQYKIRMVKEVDPSVPFNISQKRTILLCNMLDGPSAMDNFEVLEELYGSQFDMLAVSALDGTNLDVLRRAVFDLLRIIRIYPKEPGKQVDRSTPPYTIPRDSTLIDFAGAVHKDFLNLKYARLWGEGAKFDGQTINRDQILYDGNVVELHL